MGRGGTSFSLSSSSPRNRWFSGIGRALPVLRPRVAGSRATEYVKTRGPSRKAPFPLHANAGPAPNDDANAVGAKSSATILLPTPPLPFSPFSSFEILLLFFSSSSDFEDNGRRRGKSIRMQTRIVSLGDVETLGGSSFIWGGRRADRVIRRAFRGHTEMRLLFGKLSGKIGGIKGGVELFEVEGRRSEQSLIVN